MTMPELPPMDRNAFVSAICDFIDHVRAFLADLVSAVALAILFPVNLEWWGDPKKPEECDKNRTPILLIHGFLGSSNNWIYHRNRLAKAGYKNIFTINLGDPRLSIEKYADIVAGKVKEIEKLTGCHSIALVGHSMGGLVAQKYLYSDRSAGIEVKKIITIGTPLHGTHAARLASWISESAREMLYKSEFVETLQNRAKMDTGTEYDTIATKTDYIVRPVLSAHGWEKPRSTKEVLSATGHVSYLFSPSVAKRLEESLQTVQPISCA